LRPDKWRSGVSLHGSNPELLMSALGHVWTAPWQELSDVAAALVGCGHVSGPVALLEPNAVTNLEPLNKKDFRETVIKKFNLTAATDRLHKKSIFCTKSSLLVGLYVQSRTRGRAFFGRKGGAPLTNEIGS
jgi:hypothetical protein